MVSLRLKPDPLRDQIVQVLSFAGLTQVRPCVCLLSEPFGSARFEEILLKHNTAIFRQEVLENLLLERLHGKQYVITQQHFRPISCAPRDRIFIIYSRSPALPIPLPPYPSLCRAIATEIQQRRHPMPKRNEGGIREAVLIQGCKDPNKSVGYI